MMENYACKRQLHFWPTTEEAEKCCNGFIRVMAPFRYGITKTTGGASVHPDEWYQPGRLWKAVLIPEERTSEIERLLTLCPMEMLSSTQSNGWMKTAQ